MADGYERVADCGCVERWVTNPLCPESAAFAYYLTVVCDEHTAGHNEFLELIKALNEGRIDDARTE